jgi:hypothetical protein
MKGIALITAALGLGWITLGEAMDRDWPIVSEPGYAEGKSVGTPHLNISTVPSPARDLSLDTGHKKEAVPVRRLDTYAKPAKNAGNDPKVYNPISIPLW